jgi:hypothetical protein
MNEGSAGSRGRPSFHILTDINGSFLARNEAGRISLLVPVTDTRPPAERVAGDVSLGFHTQVHFELPGTSFDSNAAVIEYSDEAVGGTFQVLASELARELDARRLRPTPQEVSQALARWEELLRARRALTRDEELGLWGELWLLLQLPDVTTAVSTWRGPDAEWVDFVGGGIGIECKASRRRLEHFVSQEQLTRPLGDLNVFLLSLWLDFDTVEGRTVNDLISEVDRLLGDRREFEEKLLGTGYSRGDAHLYKLRLRVLERPLLFPSRAVPRVRTMDAGVSQIRFMATLNEDQALSAASGLAVMMRLCGK